jgi:hypothetical protein
VEEDGDPRREGGIMNRSSIIVSVPAIVLGIMALGAPTSSAVEVDPDSGTHSRVGRPAETPPPQYDHTYNYPEYKLDPVLPAPNPHQVSIEVDDQGAEALQAGASALGGAAIAFAGMWLHRRRHPVTS